MNRLFIFSILLFFSCNGERKHIGNETDADPKDTTELKFMGYQYYENFLNDSLRENKLKKSIQDGDTASYESVREDYLIGGYRDELLFYAILMAEKYQYSEACFDVFSGLDTSLYGSLTSENYLYKKIADYYLIQAYIKGSRSAKFPIKERFGDAFDSLRIIRYMKKLERHLIKEEINY